VTCTVSKVGKDVIMSCFVHAYKMRADLGKEGSVCDATWTAL